MLLNYTTGGNLDIDIPQEILLTGTKTYDGNTNVDGSTINRMSAQGRIQLKETLIHQPFQRV